MIDFCLITIDYVILRTSSQLVRCKEIKFYFHFDIENWNLLYFYYFTKWVPSYADNELHSEILKIEDL